MTGARAGGSLRSDVQGTRAWVGGPCTVRSNASRVMVI